MFHRELLFLMVAMHPKGGQEHDLLKYYDLWFESQYFNDILNILCNFCNLLVLVLVFFMHVRMRTSFRVEVQ